MYIQGNKKKSFFHKIGCNNSRVVGHVVSHTKLVIHELTDIWIVPIDQRVALVLPGVVLGPEGLELGVLPPSGKVLIEEAGILDKWRDVLPLPT